VDNVVLFTKVVPMKVYDRDKVEELIEAASTLLGNMYDNGSAGPSKHDTDAADLPKDEDGDPVWPDVFELQQAVDAIRNDGQSEPEHDVCDGCNEILINEVLDLINAIRALPE